MNRIKNSLIALAGTLALLAVVAAFTPGTTQGQSGSTSSKDVNVVNTPAVRAQQEGSWSVSLAEGASVGIDPARNKVKLDDSAREPLTIALDLKQSSHDQTLFFNEPFHIPEGKRLVIEHVNGTLVRWEGHNFPPTVYFLFGEGSGDGPVNVAATPQYRSETNEVVKYSITQPLKLYVPNPANDGLPRHVQLVAQNIGGPLWDVYLSGYLEPLP